MPHLQRPIAWLLVLAAIVLASYPLWGESFYVRLITKVMVLAIFAMSLDLLGGYTGLVSLGHAAVFGVGGYVAAAMINKAGIVNGFAILPASLAASAVVAAVIGWIAIRTSGIYFIMITLALAQMVYYFFHDMRFWGGADGINIDSRPIFGWGETALVDLSDRAQMFWLTFALMIGVFLLLSVLLRSPFGRTIVGIRLNEGRMRALGYQVANYKLMAFVIAGTIAGLAGFLEASRATFMNPAHVSWHESGLVLVIVLLGGMGTLWGPILGAFILVLLEDYVSGVTDRWLLVMGLFVIAMVLFLPNGVAGLINRVTGASFKKKPRTETLTSGAEVTDG